LTLASAYTGGTTVQLNVQPAIWAARLSLGNGHYGSTANSTLTDVVGNPLDGKRRRQTAAILQPQLHRCPSFRADLRGREQRHRRARDLSSVDGGSFGERLANGGWDRAAGPGARMRAQFVDPDYWRVELLAGDVVSVSVNTPGSDLIPYVLLRKRRGSGARGRPIQRSERRCVRQPLRGGGERQLLRRGWQVLL